MVESNLKNLGVDLFLDFITQAEEDFLLKNINKSSCKSTKGRNSIQRFGSSMPYKSNMVSNKIPEYFNSVLDKLIQQNLLEKTPDSVSVNEYFSGQSITPHIDSKTSGKIITILSLMNEATMVFERNKEKHSLLLPARSLVQMKNEIREQWLHSIPPVKNTRYSIVFRCSES
jgi:alkylated DNA repair dioxygenase AlkB